MTEWSWRTDGDRICAIRVGWRAEPWSVMEDLESIAASLSYSFPLQANPTCACARVQQLDATAGCTFQHAVKFIYVSSEHLTFGVIASPDARHLNEDVGNAALRTRGGHRSFVFPPVTSMEGFADYEQPWKCWLPNLISMLLWSSVNLPDSRLCLPCGQSALDRCCCCGFRLSAAVAGRRTLI